MNAKSSICRLPEGYKIWEPGYGLMFSFWDPLLTTVSWLSIYLSFYIHIWLSSISCFGTMGTRTRQAVCTRDSTSLAHVATTFLLMTEGRVLVDTANRKKGRTAAFSSHTPTCQQSSDYGTWVHTAKAACSQKVLPFWRTTDPVEGESMFWLCGPNSWVLYISEKDHRKLEKNLLKNPWFLFCFSLFVCAVSSCKSPKHFDHCFFFLFFF